MLTMTVMQHERGAVAQLSTETAESEDVLTRLRHLHHTLQECNWRVQLVDHALCAQGDKDHHGLQNQTANDHNLEIQARKDCSLQKQAKENLCLQLESEKDCSPQNETEEDQDVEEHLRATFDSREQIKDDGLRKQSEKDQNYQNEVQEESENQSCEDYYHQKPAEERHSLLTKEQKPSVQADDDSHDLYDDTEKNLFDCTEDDSDLSNQAISDHIMHDYAKKDNHIHNEKREEKGTQNSVKNVLELDSTDLLEKKCHKYLTRQGSIDMDDGDSLAAGTIDTSSSTIGLPHISKDPNVDEISPVPDTMTDISEQHHQLINSNEKFSEKTLKQKDSQKCHYVGKVTCGPNGVKYAGNKICFDADTNFLKNQKKGNASQDHQQKSEKIEDVKFASEISPADPSPEVAQRMDVIWEALENLRSHFFALHSSLVDSSSLFCSQEFAESLDNSYITIKEDDNVAECGELHVMPENDSERFHQTTSETTQLQEALCEQTFHRKLPVGNYPHCSCHNLSRNQMSSHTPLEESAKSAPLTANVAHTPTYSRGWRETCLFMMMMVLLLLLFLFLACCLLLVLPVVSVSVRTAGGLPAF